MFRYVKSQSLALALLLMLTVLANLALAVLPPKYLAVAHFQQCLATTKINQYQIWCAPTTKPKTCPLASWQKLMQLKKVGEIPRCR